MPRRRVEWGHGVDRRILGRLHAQLFGYTIRAPPPIGVRKGTSKYLQKIGKQHYYVYPGVLGRPGRDGKRLGNKKILLPGVEYYAKHDGVVYIEQEKVFQDAMRIFRQLGLRPKVEAVE